MTLGEQIKTNRMRHQLSQAKLGEYLSVTQQAVAKWEKDVAEPDSSALKLMATLFQTSIDELLCYNGLTDEERAAGATEIKKISIIPIEDEMLYLFREVGRKHGEKAQRALISVAENMI